MVITDMIVIGAFALGLALYGVGSLGLRRSKWQTRYWRCPDTTCNQSFTHARYMARHIIEMHPNLVPLDDRR